MTETARRTSALLCCGRVGTRCVPRLLAAAWLAGAFITISLTSCQNQTQPSQMKPIFSTDDGKVQMQFPVGWFENTKDHPFDLQCMSGDLRLNTGAYCYNREDLASDLTPTNTLAWHIDDLQSKREQFEVKEEEQTIEFAGKKLTSVVYTGERDSGKYCYKFTLIEFAQHPDLFVVVLQVALPSSWSRAKLTLDEIVKSTRIQDDSMQQ